MDLRYYPDLSVDGAKCVERLVGDSVTSKGESNFSASLIVAILSFFIYSFIIMWAFSIAHEVVSSAISPIGYFDASKFVLVLYAWRISHFVLAQFLKAMKE